MSLKILRWGSGVPRSEPEFDSIPQLRGHFLHDSSFDLIGRVPGTEMHGDNQFVMESIRSFDDVI
jgi:hypothetical protein